MAIIHDRKMTSPAPDSLRHDWVVPDEEAIEIQRRLAPLVSRTSALPETPSLIAGVDVSGADEQGFATAAATLLRFPGFEVEEVAQASAVLEIRYKRSLLSFREVPLILAALERLSTTPDLVLVDGHGIAHPRRFGLASHTGLLTGLPTIGCAKSLLLGSHGPLGNRKGAQSALQEDGEVIGTALRSKDSTRPIYVSIGHKLDLESAVEWVLACCVSYRLPEPLRTAHQAARR